jgi:Domain of unknown function (DUF4833)
MSGRRPVAYVLVCSDTPIRERGSMKKAIWWFAILALLAAPAAAQMKTSPLFIIERSKNANVVHYDARLTADGNLDPEEPVIAYWVRLAENGRREELSWIEKKKAYGFTIKPDPSASGYKMSLVAVPGPQITVKKEKDTVRAEAVIDGRPTILEKMYINASGGLTGPNVHYIEVYGKDLQTGEERREKMVPK